LNDRTVEIFRTFLTVVGILLLVIFGSRAAAQARNMKLAGASHKSVFAVGTDIMNVLGFGKANPVVSYKQQPITSRLPAQIQPATPLTSSPSSSSGQTGSKQKPAEAIGSESTASANAGLHKATGTVNNVTTKTQQVVNNVTKNTTDDFTNLWP
jgi:hypothetical protein